MKRTLRKNGEARRDQRGRPPSVTEWGLMTVWEYLYEGYSVREAAARAGLPYKPVQEYFTGYDTRGGLSWAEGLLAENCLLSGWPQTEVAERFGVNVNTIRSRFAGMGLDRREVGRVNSLLKRLERI